MTQDPIKHLMPLRQTPQRNASPVVSRSASGTSRVLETTRTWAQLPLFVRQPVGR
jgi:hypothetical protein